MISRDQPTIFNNTTLSVAISSRVDRSMLNRLQPGDERVKQARRDFLYGINISPKNILSQWITYGEAETYDDIYLLDATARQQAIRVGGIRADGIIVQGSGVGIFLPVADCIATVLYDPVRRIFGLLHMGRHSTLTSILPNAIKQFINLGTKPDDIKVWMSPHAQRNSYVLRYFTARSQPAWQGFYDEKVDSNSGETLFYIDMAGYNRQQLLNAGVNANNIQISTVDTVTSENYFSHSAGDILGRNGVVAYLA
ncbi:polyphenol oxidase family protein [Candidatus Saccharibacteria bacterium]|nr:polyphenol oxidase family protein [Candidatus Saccharibacteria bacterium]